MSALITNLPSYKGRLFKIFKQVKTDSIYSNSANPKLFGSPFAAVDLFHITRLPQALSKRSIKSSVTPVGILPTNTFLFSWAIVANTDGLRSSSATLLWAN